MTLRDALRLVLRASGGAVYALLLHGLLRGGEGRPDPVGTAALLVPALVSTGLLLVFAATLRAGREPMIARVAQAMERDPIPPPLLGWLRTVTVAWCGFFAANALVSASLALCAPLSWWTLWNGALAYGAVAFLLLAEYVARKIRYRWYRDGLLDRFWRRAFPSRPTDDYGPGGASAGSGSGRSSDVT